MQCFAPEWIRYFVRFCWMAWFSFVNDRPEDYVTKWLSNIACPVLRVDGTMPVEKNVADILTFLASRSCAKKQNGGKRP